MEGVAKPLAGIDYPRTFTEFDKFFSEEAVCREYLSRLRWPSGFVCAMPVAGWSVDHQPRLPALPGM